MTSRTGAGAVSVIVPVRDEAATLHDFLLSLTNQLKTPHEIVLVDAGSTDGSGHIMRQYAARDTRMRVVESGAAYPGRARNVAIEGARGPWIAMTDAGTIVDAEWLRELTAAADREPHAAVVFGTYEPLMRTFFETCVALAFVAPGRTVDGRRFRGPTTASLMIQKEAWQQLGGFPEDLRACEDLVFFQRLAERGYQVVCAPRATVNWRVPGTFGAVFRRFRAYSHHTLKAGLGAEWHRRVASMYVAAAAALLLGAAVHWSLGLLPIGGLAARVARAIRDRPDVMARSGRATLRTYTTIAAVLLWIDLAAFAGAVDYARGRLTGRDPARQGSPED